MINPDKMYEAMNDYAQMHLCMLNIQQKTERVPALVQFQEAYSIQNHEISK